VETRPRLASLQLRGGLVDTALVGQSLAGGGIDSAHDAQKSRVELANAEATDWIIKWNPRKQDLEAWWKRAEQERAIVTDLQKLGRRTALLEDILTCKKAGRCYAFRRLVRVIERTVDRKDQPLLLPEREIEGWWTNLDLPAAQVISLYNDHGTAEQFHSEFKTDMDVELAALGQVLDQRTHARAGGARLQHPAAHWPDRVTAGPERTHQRSFD
jgi:hypothetical protein